MLGTKDNMKNCCDENKSFRFKTPTYSEVYCKKCGFVIASNDMANYIYENKEN